ncbi:hypothetical protein [Photobacterium nomapromontoriensis]|uniref:hypothetical protein n=1 Tax=Photobacterium nomapromontoriensis TaxID=2910237 RepID=UPI003D0B1FAD
MSNVNELKSQLVVTIDALELKFNSTSEPVILDYLKRYKDVLNSIILGASNCEIYKSSKKLLNCSRGYLETATDYNQDFLYKMAKTEQIIKNLDN